MNRVGWHTVMNELMVLVLVCFSSDGCSFRKAREAGLDLDCSEWLPATMHCTTNNPCCPHVGAEHVDLFCGASTWWGWNCGGQHRATHP